MKDPHRSPAGPSPGGRIALVGPCSAGKTTLKKRLMADGFEVRAVAQEHSYVPDMWRRISRPDILIFLDVDYPTARARRPHIDGGPGRLAEQHRRLAHARKHCDFYLDTSDLSLPEVERQVRAYLARYGARAAGEKNAPAGA